MRNYALTLYFDHLRSIFLKDQLAYLKNLFLLIPNLFCIYVLLRKVLPNQLGLFCLSKELVNNFLNQYIMIHWRLLECYHPISIYLILIHQKVLKANNSKKLFFSLKLNCCKLYHRMFTNNHILVKDYEEILMYNKYLDLYLSSFHRHHNKYV